MTDHKGGFISRSDKSRLLPSKFQPLVTGGEVVRTKTTPTFATLTFGWIGFNSENLEGVIFAFEI